MSSQTMSAVSEVGNAGEETALYLPSIDFKWCHNETPPEIYRKNTVRDRMKCIVTETQN